MAWRIGEILRGLFKPSAEPDAAPAAEPVDYKGYAIHPMPRQTGGSWTTQGRITKQFSEGPKRVDFIRADTNVEHADAIACCILKAKRIIDEQGDGMFKG